MSILLQILAGLIIRSLRLQIEGAVTDPPAMQTYFEECRAVNGHSSSTHTVFPKPSMRWHLQRVGEGGREGGAGEEGEGGRPTQSPTWRTQDAGRLHLEVGASKLLDVGFLSNKKELECLDQNHFPDTVSTQSATSGLPTFQEPAM